ncbi:MAG: SURF1 family protein [Nocardioides sp.]
MVRALAPRYWAIHLLAVAGLVFTGLLGFWQLHVWQDHRDARAADLTHQPAVPLDDVLGPDAAFPGDGVGRPVLVRGTWDSAGSVTVGGRPGGGTWLVTPVRTPSGSEVPVVRGLLAPGAAAPAPPAGDTRLTGWLQPPEDPGVPDPHPGDRALPELSITGLLPLVSRDLYGGYVVVDLATSATNAPGQGLTQASLDALPDAGSFTALRNLLYAIEWWFFGAFVIFMWWRWLQDDVLAGPRQPEPAG